MRDRRVWCSECLPIDREVQKPSLHGAKINYEKCMHPSTVSTDHTNSLLPFAQRAKRDQRVPYGQGVLVSNIVQQYK